MRLRLVGIETARSKLPRAMLDWICGMVQACAYVSGASCLPATCLGRCTRAPRWRHARAQLHQLSTLVGGLARAGAGVGGGAAGAGTVARRSWSDRRARVG